eukprot:1540043-Pyramimonas_sp.AAC.1
MASRPPPIAPAAFGNPSGRWLTKEGLGSLEAALPSRPRSMRPATIPRMGAIAPPCQTTRRAAAAVPRERDKHNAAGSAHSR